MKQKVDPEKLRQLHAQGLTRTQIAKELGVSASTVDLNLKKLGLKNHSSLLTKEQENEILMLIASGYSRKQTMSECNISANHYYRMLKIYRAWLKTNNL